MGTAAFERGVELRGLQKTYRSPGGSTGWAIVIAWTIACAVLARRAYARDTQRV